MLRKGVKIGVDLGTANTLVYIDGQGIIFNEPSIVAYDTLTGKDIAVGHSAYAMMGKTHDQIRIVKPMAGGVISDLDATSTLFMYIFSKMKQTNINFSKSTLLICYPSAVSQIERIAMIKLANKIGIKDVFIEEEVKAGAIGAGIDIFSSEGSMIIDIGGGTTDIGVLSLGDLVVSNSIRVAGDYLDQSIMKYIKLKHELLIGPRTAEDMKIALGSLRKEITEEKFFTCAGRNLINGLPCKKVISQREIQHIFFAAVDSIINAAKKVLMQAPPELAADIHRKGVFVNGGGAILDGLDQYLAEALHLKVTITKNPLTSIVEGSKMLLRNRGNYLVKPMD